MIHQPVLLSEVLAGVREIHSEAKYFLDGTFGRGGHAKEILNAREDFRVIGMDCDQEAIEFGLENFSDFIACGRLRLIRSNFLHFAKALTESMGEPPRLAGVLLDLGVSSPQLDDGRRGFSFYHDGPLDMRMNQELEMTAADIVNNWSEESLNELFRNLGEIPRPFRVTRNIVDMRKQKPFKSTLELSSLIEKLDGWHKKGHHPATRYFMALRLEVNQELSLLEKVLPDLAKAIAPGGHFLVITFHSLEDRIVKTSFKSLVEAGVGELVNKKVIQASWDEKKGNPRARSAKLRIFRVKGEIP